MTPKPYRRGLTKPQKRERRRRQRAAVRTRREWLKGLDADTFFMWGECEPVVFSGFSALASEPLLTGPDDIHAVYETIRKAAEQPPQRPVRIVSPEQYETLQHLAAKARAGVATEGERETLLIWGIDPSEATLTPCP